MINHQHKFIFVHIPRCGGNFINTFFEPMYIEENLDTKGPNVDGDNFELDHYPLHRYLKLFPDCKNYFKFAFIRNPWAKVLSDFFFKKYGAERGGMWGPCTRFINCKKLEFPEYIRILDQKFQGVNQLKQTNQHLVSHFISYHDYIGDGSELDFLGRLENFSEDFSLLCKKFNINYIPEDKKNSVEHLHYTEYYSEKTKDIVYKLYQNDIENFGYQFGD